MFEIEFYQNKKGISPVKKYIDELTADENKQSRVKMNKILDYIKVLEKYGTRAGEPFVKHLDGDIWELRPLRSRVLFFGCDGNRIVLLHHFIKKTQKTPIREIEQAKRNMKDYIARSEDDDE